MKTSIIGLGLSAILLQAAPAAAKIFRKNIVTFEVDPGAEIHGNKIEYSDPDCDPEFQCITTKTCAAAGTVPTLNEDKKFFACCREGQCLLGSADTAFDCCAAGHDLAGSAETSYHCCPTGFSYDGKLCQQKCSNGKQLVNGACVCPQGTTEAGDGCKVKPQSDCSSGLESGKCYIFTGEIGEKLGLSSDGVYYAAAESMVHRYGKFQICLDEKCTPGKAVNPSDTTYIRDVYGTVATGANPGMWLNNAANGAHIGQTANFGTAGKFALSKWPCGKYCLGGIEWGVGPACPAQTPAMTFYSLDPQMCVPFELTEVPCDIKADKNNCIWKNGNQCCNKVDCSTWP